MYVGFSYDIKQMLHLLLLVVVKELLTVKFENINYYNRCCLSRSDMGKRAGVGGILQKRQIQYADSFHKKCAIESWR